MDWLLVRLFREFAVTLSTVVLISLIVSLYDDAECMCADARAAPSARETWLVEHDELDRNDARIDRDALSAALRNPLVVAFALFSMIGLNAPVSEHTRYSLFPVQDTGLLMGAMWGDQSTSFQSIKDKLSSSYRFVSTIRRSPMSRA